MSKKDLYSGAEIVGNASSAKFTAVSQELGKIRKDWSDFSERQSTISEALIQNADGHEERLQTLEDNRNFVRISRHGLEEMEPHEQEFLAGWLQKLILELKARGIASNANQQEFLANLFKFIGVRDVLMQQRGGLETLENVGGSEFHEAIYKVFLILCYLIGNNFDILAELEDIDQMFKLNAADKSKLRGLLENERIPTLGVPGLVRMFDQSRPLNSLSVEALISRHLDIRSHSLLRFGLDKASYSIYLKTFALLVPESGKFTERQRNFLSALATMFGCPECVFELDQLCINPQNVNIRAWQALLDTEDKKYSWALDGAALLGMNPDFDPEKDDVVEQVLKGVKLSDTRDFLIATTRLTRETNPAKLYEMIKKVNARCKGWKHIIEYCGSSLKDAFSELRAELNRYHAEIMSISLECSMLTIKTSDNRFWIGSSDWDSTSDKIISAIGGKAVEMSRAVNVSDLRGVKKKAEGLFSLNMKTVRDANAVLLVFGLDCIDIDHWHMNDSEFELDNSASNERWGDDYDRLDDQLQGAFQSAAETADLLESQLRFFEKGKLYESILVKKQQEKEERAKQMQAELEAMRSVRIGEGDAAQIVSIVWREIKELPFKPDEISKIVSNGTSWMALVNERELFHSEDGETWSAVEMPAAVSDCRSIKYVHEAWILMNGLDKSYFSIDGKTWLKLIPPSNLSSYTYDVMFFDGQWLFLGNSRCEYTYTEKEKGIFRDSTKTKTGNYDAPIFYRSKSLQGPWEQWKEASNLTEGLTLTTQSIGVRENVLTAGLEYDRLYVHRKNMSSQVPRVSYITLQGRWKSATWPTDKVERCTGKFYLWGKKSIYLDGRIWVGSGRTIIASANGYEWTVAANDISFGDELLEAGSLLLLPRNGRNTAHLSNDGVNFCEIALSGSDSGKWNHFATNHKAILATFSPSCHQTFLRRGTIQMTGQDTL